MNKTNQQLWNEALINAFYLKSEHTNMYSVVHSFAQSINLSEKEIFELSLANYPFNESIHLCSTPIHFVCAYVPELAALLWSKSENNIEDTLIEVSTLNSQVQRQAENSEYENLTTKHRKEVKSKIGLRSIELNKQFNQKVSLNWSSPKNK